MYVNPFPSQLWHNLVAYSSYLPDHFSDNEFYACVEPEELWCCATLMANVCFPRPICYFTRLSFLTRDET